MSKIVPNFIKNAILLTSAWTASSFMDHPVKAVENTSQKDSVSNTMVVIKQSPPIPIDIPSHPAESVPCMILFREAILEEKLTVPDDKRTKGKRIRPSLQHQNKQYLSKKPHSRLRR